MQRSAALLAASVVLACSGCDSQAGRTILQLEPPGPIAGVEVAVEALLVTIRGDGSISGGPVTLGTGQDLPDNNEIMVRFIDAHGRYTRGSVARADCQIVPADAALLSYIPIDGCWGYLRRRAAGATTVSISLVRTDGQEVLFGPVFLPVTISPP